MSDQNGQRRPKHINHHQQSLAKRLITPQVVEPAHRCAHWYDPVSNSMCLCAQINFLDGFIAICSAWMPMRSPGANSLHIRLCVCQKERCPPNSQRKLVSCVSQSHPGGRKRTRCQSRRHEIKTQHQEKWERKSQTAEGGGDVQKQRIMIIKMQDRT